MSKPYSRRSFIQTSTGVAMAAGTTSAARTSGTTPNDRITIGQIGTGHGHATGKMKTLRQNPRFEVVGIVESDPELRARAKKNEVYAGLEWLTEEQLLNAPGLKAVAVETTVPYLLPTAEACIKAGKHVHLDKPAGAALPHFDRILNEAQRRKLTVQMGYMFRYNPGVVLIRDLLRKGWLGEPFEMHCVISKRVGPAGRLGPALYSGGMMFELGCHMIDVVVGLLGKPDDVTGYLQHAGRDADDLADNTLAVFKYPRALATVKSSVLEVDGSDRRHIAICGSEGTVHIQPMRGPVAQVAMLKPRGKYRKGYQEVKLPPYTRYIDDIEDFARIITGEKENSFSSQHDHDVQWSVLKACNMRLDKARDQPSKQG